MPTPNASAPLYQWYIFQFLIVGGSVLGLKPFFFVRINDPEFTDTITYIAMMWWQLLTDREVFVTAVAGTLITAFITTAVLRSRITLPGWKKWAGIGVDRWFSAEWAGNLPRKFLVYFAFGLIGLIASLGWLIAYNAVDVQTPMTMLRFVDYLLDSAFHLTIGGTWLSYVVVAVHAAVGTAAFAGFVMLWVHDVENEKK